MKINFISKKELLNLLLDMYNDDSLTDELLELLISISKN